MSVSATSRFLLMLDHGGSAVSSLRKLEETGVVRDDFQSILDSYHQGNYKTNLENGTVDDYRYGLLAGRRIEKPDFERYLNKVFGAETTSVISSDINPFDDNGQAILNNGMVVIKQPPRIINVPEQNRSTGWQSLVERTLAEMIQRPVTPAPEPISALNQAPQSTSKLNSDSGSVEFSSTYDHLIVESQLATVEPVEMRGTIDEEVGTTEDSGENAIALFLNSFRGVDYPSYIDALYGNEV